MFAFESSGGDTYPFGPDTIGLSVRKPEHREAVMAAVLCLLGFFLDVRDFGRRLSELLRGEECLPESSFVWVFALLSGHLSAKWPTFLHL